MPQLQTAGGEKVVAFRLPPTGAKRALSRESTERGTILLFTGVRYERQDDESKEELDLGSERRDAEIWS